MAYGFNMSTIQISFMEQNDIQQSAKVLSIAMLNNPHHIGVFLGKGEKQRLEIEIMFFELFKNLPGVTFLAKENEKIIGVMRMKSCIGKAIAEPDMVEDENDINRKFSGSQIAICLETHKHHSMEGIAPSYSGRNR
jgi:hypothetical protein